MNHFDVAIVGAGPAGSFLAFLLSKSGYNTCIIDRSCFPRDKLCGGLMTGKTLDILSQNIDCASIPFFATDKVSIFYKYNKVLSFDAVNSFYLCQRLDFDNILLKYAQQCGTTCFLGKEVTVFDLANRKLILSSGECIDYDVLVGADGALSKTRSNLLVESPSLGCCVEISSVDRQQLPFNATDEIQMFVGDIDNGYSWIFPKYDGFTIGTGSIYNKTCSSNIKEHFFEFCKNIKCNNSKFKGAFIPTGDRVHLGNKLFSNACLIGDAAGFIDPITGEGIYYALLSAQVLYSSIIECTNPYNLLDIYNEQANPIITRIYSDHSIHKQIYNTIFLSSVLNSLNHSKQYVASLIDETVNKYSKTYSELYNELRMLMR